MGDIVCSGSRFKLAVRDGGAIKESLHVAQLGASDSNSGTNSVCEFPRRLVSGSMRCPLRMTGEEAIHEADLISEKEAEAQAN